MKNNAVKHNAVKHNAVKHNPIKHNPSRKAAIAPALVRALALGLALTLTLGAGLPLASARVMETTPAANQEDADFAAGKKAVERKDWKGAVDALNKALQRLPENADLHNLLGYAYRHLNDLDNSFRHYKEALRIDPKHRGAHEYIGQAYLKAQQPEKAAEHLAELEKLCGKNCEEYRDLAKAIASYNKQK